MPDFGFDLEEIRRLIALVERRGLSRLVVEDGDRRVAIRGTASRRPGPARDAAEAEAIEDDAQFDSEVRVAQEIDRIAVTAPTVGVFYRAGTPDAPPLVEVGDRIEVGQPVGLLEAMKVFSEILSEHSGLVLEMVAHNGALVREGDTLMYLKAD